MPFAIERDVEDEQPDRREPERALGEARARERARRRFAAARTSRARSRSACRRRRSSRGCSRGRGRGGPHSPARASHSAVHGRFFSDHVRRRRARGSAAREEVLRAGAVVRAAARRRSRARSAPAACVPGRSAAIERTTTTAKNADVRQELRATRGAGCTWRRPSAARARGSRSSASRRGRSTISTARIDPGAPERPTGHGAYVLADVAITDERAGRAWRLRAPAPSEDLLHHEASLGFEPAPMSASSRSKV